MSVIDLNKEAFKRLLAEVLKDGDKSNKKVDLLNKAVEQTVEALSKRFRYMTPALSQVDNTPFLVHVDEQGVVSYASEDALTVATHRMHHQLFGYRDVDAIVTGYQREMKQPERLLRTEEIRPFKWKGEPGLAYCMLPLARYDEPNIPPLFAEFLSRVETEEERQALVLWFGSVLDMDLKDRAQYLYIQGEGGDGKSSLVHAVGSLFGRGYAPISSDTLGKRFGTASLEGVRLLEIADNNSSAFVTTSLFKRITGEQSIEAEHKGQDMRIIPLICKTVVTSNFPPDSSGNNADERRLMYVRVKKYRNPVDVSVLKAMREAGGQFLAYCDTQYRQWRVANPTAELPTSAQAKEVVAQTSVRSEAEEVFDGLFIYTGSKEDRLEASRARADIRKAAAMYRSSVEKEVVRKLRTQCGPTVPTNGKRYYVGIRAAGPL